MKKVDQCGNIFYYNEQNQPHRDDGGPAAEMADGTKFWCINGQLHRVNGTAVEWSNGKKEYWIDDKKLSEEEFWAHPEVLLHWIVNLPD